MKPKLKRDRWLTLDEVIALLVDRYPKLLALHNKSRRQRVRRILKRVEQRDGERYTKLHGRELVVSRNALESLLPYDARVWSRLEESVAKLAQNQRSLKRQVNGHGSKIRQLEKKQELTTQYLAAIQAVDRVRRAS